MKVKSGNNTIFDSAQPDEILAALARHLMSELLHEAEEKDLLHPGDTFYLELNDTYLLLCQAVQVDGKIERKLLASARYGYCGFGYELAEELSKAISKLLGQGSHNHSTENKHVILYYWLGLTVV